MRRMFSLNQCYFQFENNCPAALDFNDKLGLNRPFCWRAVWLKECSTGPLVSDILGIFYGKFWLVMTVSSDVSIYTNTSAYVRGVWASITIATKQALPLILLTTFNTHRLHFNTQTVTMFARTQQCSPHIENRSVFIQNHHVLRYLL